MTLVSSTEDVDRLHVFWPIDTRFFKGDVLLGWRQEAIIVVAGSKSLVNVKWSIILLFSFANEFVSRKRRLLEF